MHRRRIFSPVYLVICLCLVLSACVGLLGKQKSSSSSTTTELTNRSFVAGNSAFMVTTDGRLWASGDNRCGQLGTGNSSNRSSFKQVLSGMAVASDVTAVVAQAYVHVPKADIDTTSVTTASAAMASAAAMTAISSTCISSSETTIAYSTFAIKSDHSLWATGNNDYGQLGTGNSSNRSSFKQVLSNVTSVVSNGLSTFAIVQGTYGTVLYATGLNNQGQLGLGDTTNRTSFTRVYLDHSETADSTTSINDMVAQVAITHNGTALVRTSGTTTSEDVLWVAGTQMGNVAITSSTAYEFAQLLTAVSSITTNGYSTAFAIKSDQSLWACGENSDGEFGNGTTVSPGTCESVLTDVSSVVAAATNTMALKADGTLWVSGAYGPALGLANGVDTFTQISLATTSAIEAVSTTGTSSYCLTTDGDLWAAGANDVGQLGSGDNTTLSAFYNVDGAVESFADLGLFSTSLLLRDTTGYLWSVGNNGSGQLGISSGTSVDTLTKVSVTISS